VLEEVKNVPQQDGAPGYRRWFADDELDLIVWYSTSGQIRGFQLCYDIKGDERAFTWREERGLTHTAIDAGEDSPLHNRSPILVSDPRASVEKAVASFKARSKTIDPAIVEFVSTKLTSTR
jgi:hypothetical protein